jgi:glycerophosphoryl diester phosphodiesterase
VSRRAYFDHDGVIPFAHRGGAKLWPENTLPAFRGAIEAGYRWIETDVQLTRDRQVVIFHDDLIDRTTDGRGPIAQLSLRELRRYDAGFWFSPRGRGHPFRGQGITVPTLEEAFDLHPQLRLNVELKSADPVLGQRLLEIIEHLGVQDRILVAGERSSVIRSFRRLSRGRLATSAGRREVAQFWAAARLGLERLLPVDYDALQVPPRERVEVVTRRFVEAAHRRGLAVHVWTIDEPAEMHRLLDLGVDGVMTDRPDLLREVMGDRSRAPR